MFSTNEGCSVYRNWGAATKKIWFSQLSRYIQSRENDGICTKRSCDKIPTRCLKEALDTWPLSANGLFTGVKKDENLTFQTQAVSQSKIFDRGLELNVISWESLPSHIRYMNTRLGMGCGLLVTQSLEGVDFSLKTPNYDVNINNLKNNLLFNPAL